MRELSAILKDVHESNAIKWHKRKSQSVWQTSLWSYFKKLPKSPQPSPQPDQSLNSHPHLRQDPQSAKRLQLPEGSDSG